MSALPIQNIRNTVVHGDCMKAMRRVQSYRSFRY